MIILKKYFPFLCLISLFLIAIPVYASESFDVSISSTADVVSPGEYITYTVSVKSELITDDEVDILISGKNLQWVTMNTYSLELEPNENKSFEFYISPTYGAPDGTYSYVLKIQSKTDSSLFTEKNIDVYISESEEVDITTLKTLKDTYSPGEKVEVLANLKNTGTLNAENYTLKIKAGELEKSKAVPLIKVGEQLAITEEFEFDRYTAKGEQVVQVFLYNIDGDVVSQDNSLFTIETKAVIKTEEKRENKIFLSRVSLVSKNEGNEKGTAEIKKRLLEIPFLYAFEKNPSYSIGNTYVWECELDPSESCTIKYTVNYWLLVLIVVVIAGLIFVTFYEIEKPRIHKKILKSGGLHSVHLTMKNKSKKVLIDVEIKDFVPGFINILGGFTIKPTSIKKKSGGNEITWKIGRLEPKDERIFSYKIKPTSELEATFKMPPARIKAVDESGKRYSATSRPSIVS